MQRDAGQNQARYRLRKDEVLRYLGYAGQHVDAALDVRVDAAIERCERASNPGFTYRVFPVEHAAEGVRLAGTTLLLTGEDIARHLQGARECAVMAATAGLGNERVLQALSAQGGVDAVVFDAAGSALAETVADACNAAIVADAHARGLFAKWRFSPGYGDLPLGLQRTIVRVLAADKKLGVSVTESDLLIPAKSVTAFVGLFDTQQDERRSCANCTFAAHCNLRKEGARCYR